MLLIEFYEFWHAANRWVNETISKIGKSGGVVVIYLMISVNLLTSLPSNSLTGHII
jgi:hypothetical protein